MNYQLWEVYVSTSIIVFAILIELRSYKSFNLQKIQIFRKKGYETAIISGKIEVYKYIFLYNYGS